MTKPARTISRRTLLATLPIASLSFHGYAAGKKMADRIFIGTNAGKSSKGIYTAKWNGTTGEVGEIALAAELDSPTFLATYLHAGQRQLYAVSERAEGDATLTAYSVEDGTQSLTKLNEQTTLGNGATFVSIHPDGHSAYVANYGGGSVTSYRIMPNGSLSKPISHVQHEGQGPDPDRQSRPHAHSALIAPGKRFLLVNDLGLDRIFIYRINAKTAELTPNDPPFWQARPRSGPRHLAFHPNGRWIYNINELDSTVDLLEWDAKRGRLTTRASVSTLAPDFPKNTAFAGEILISSDGHFVYVGNRRHESIAVMPVQPKTGEVTLAQLANNGGQNTRHIALDTTERWLVASDQDSGSIVVLARNRKTGKLSEPIHTYPIDLPMCVVFV